MLDVYFLVMGEQVRKIFGNGEMVFIVWLGWKEFAGWCDCEAVLVLR